MKKFHIRYAKKADIPADRVEYYQPLNPAEPDGAHIWSGFEPDPDGFALVKAGDLQRQLLAATNDATRRNQQLQGYRKKKDDDKSELYSPEEIEAAFAEIARLKEAAGKQPNAEDLRKQIHTELSTQFTTKERGHATVLEALRAELGFYRDAYKSGKGRALAAELMHHLPKVKPGLETVALDLLVQDILFEDVPPTEGKNKYVDYEPRMRGPNGFRLDSNTGKPIDPKAYATGDFLRQYGQMFEPRQGTNGTGVQNSPHGGGGGGGGGQGGGDGKWKGSGNHKMKRSEMVNDVGAYQRKLKSVPQGDFLQIVNDGDGVVAGEVPGQAAAARA